MSSENNPVTIHLHCGCSLAAHLLAKESNLLSDVEIHKKMFATHAK
jgi:hypothetical protein